MLNSKSIGNKIAAARKKINLSQAELAQQVSISSQAVGKWERGESMPDIATLNRVAEITGVDLNYFSDNFQSVAGQETENRQIQNETAVHSGEGEKKQPDWDMSKLNLTDSDFSGLKNLHEEFSSSNMQRCLFIGSDMAGLRLHNNNIDECDFTDCDLSRSHIHGSNIGRSTFNASLLKETVIEKCNVSDCDFTDADFAQTTLRASNFGKNTITNAKLNGTIFKDMQLQDIVFEGVIEGCFFENCSFQGVKFSNATLLNTFFKNNRKMKRVEFSNCKVDKITYAFLKSNMANLTGITLLL